MGNKRNRSPRRKKRFCNASRKSTYEETSTLKNENDSDIVFDPSVVNVVSILGPISDAQYAHDYTLDPITPTTENITQDVYDPLFVPKSEIISSSTSNAHSIEFPNVGELKTEQEIKIEPQLNEDLVEDEQTSNAFNEMCRLCLTQDETTWIEIFSSKPYPYQNDYRITPSNILEIIEQSTTIKISKNDRLPDKLCLDCFQSLRFVLKFREKSLLSQKSLNLKVNALGESLMTGQDQQMKGLVNGIQNHPIKRIVKVIHLKPIPKPTPKTTRKPTFEEAHNLGSDRDELKELQCEICGMVFVKNKPLQYHMNRHNGIKPFACTEPYCDKSFYSPENLRNHKLNIHSSEPRFKCDLCEKTYNKAEKLKLHRTTHFPPTIPCTICGKLLRSQASVRKHRASHAERLYKCDDCGKSFQNAYTLRVHRRTHTNEKPFICCKCGEAFAHKCMLKAHTEKKHAD